MAEGAAGRLCDIAGLGFSSDTKKIVRPIPPAVSIKVNGEAIQLPSTPVKATNANGIMGEDIYDATCVVPATATEIPQASSRGGTAMVKCNNHGVVKTYRAALTSK